MKSKAFHKKLVLNKNTVAHLAKSDLDAVKGGYTYSCLPQTCDYICTVTKDEWCTRLTCYVC